MSIRMFAAHAAYRNGDNPTLTSESPNSFPVPAQYESGRHHRNFKAIFGNADDATTGGSTGNKAEGTQVFELLNTWSAVTGTYAAFRICRTAAADSHVLPICRRTARQSSGHCTQFSHPRRPWQVAALASKRNLRLYNS
jgi:hypothetical protein